MGADGSNADAEMSTPVETNVEASGSGPGEENVVKDDEVVMDTEEAAPEVDPKEQALEYKEKGNVEYRKKDYFSALDFYNLAIKEDPTNPAYYNNKAAAEMMLGRTTTAIKSCKKCLELEPKNGKAWTRLGGAYMKIGDGANAVEAFKKALEIDPTNGKAYAEKKEADLLFQRVKRAKECFEAGEFQHALSLAQAGLRQAPECRELNLIRAQGLIKNGDYDQAYSLTTKLMRDDQKDRTLLYLRAMCLYYQENFANAIRHLQQALQLDPDSKECQVEIKKIRKLERLKESGNTAFKTRDYAKAVEDYSECIKIDPDNKGFASKLHCNRAASLQKLGKDAEALEDCEKAIELNPEYGKAYVRRAGCLRKLGGKENLERAMHSYSEAERILGRSNDLMQNMRETKIELKKAKRKDYYKILDLKNRENSSQAEIKKAYRKSALKWHPDRHANDSDEDKAKAEAMFKDVGEAYELLSDEQKKRQYDSGQTLEEIEQGGGMHHHGMHHDPNEVFRMFFGGGGGGGFHQF